MKKYFNKILLYNILIVFAIASVLLFFIKTGLKSYTRHGEGIAVPDLRGQSIEKVEAVLNENNLELQIMDSVFDVNKPPLSVVDQNPKPKSKVKDGRMIYVTINASTAPTVEIPDLVGRSSLKYAKMQLESYGLKVGEPIYKPDPHLNAVIGVMANGKNISKNTRVQKGTEIILVLGDGLGNSKTTAPYLIGLRYEDAEYKLREYSLNVGAKIFDGEVKDSFGAIVYKQIPAYGSSIRLGEPIDLFMAKELPVGITVDSLLYYDEIDLTETQ